MAGLNQATGLYIEFWTSIKTTNENQEDVAKLNDLGTKINKVVEDIKNNFERMQKLKHNDELVIRLYSDFLLDILNEKEKGLYYKNRLNEIEGSGEDLQVQGEKNLDLDHLLSDDFQYIMISAEVEKPNIIKKVTTGICSLFGYAKDELIGQPIDILMPEQYQKLHKKILMNKIDEYKKLFANNLHSKHKKAFKSTYKEIFGVAKNKSKYLIPINIKSNLITSADQSEIYFIGKITKVISNNNLNLMANNIYMNNNSLANLGNGTNITTTDSVCYVLTDNNFILQNFSPNSIFLMGLKAKYNGNLDITRHIKELYEDPELNRIETLLYSFNNESLEDEYAILNTNLENLVDERNDNQANENTNINNKNNVNINNNNNNNFNNTSLNQPVSSQNNVNNNNSNTGNLNNYQTNFLSMINNAKKQFINSRYKSAAKITWRFPAKLKEKVAFMANIISINERKTKQRQTGENTSEKSISVGANINIDEYNNNNNNNSQPELTNSADNFSPRHSRISNNNTAYANFKDLKLKQDFPGGLNDGRRNVRPNKDIDFSQYVQEQFMMNISDIYIIGNLQGFVFKFETAALKNTANSTTSTVARTSTAMRKSEQQLSIPTKINLNFNFNANTRNINNNLQYSIEIRDSGVENLHDTKKNFNSQTNTEANKNTNFNTNNISGNEILKGSIIGKNKNFGTIIEMEKEGNFSNISSRLASPERKKRIPNEDIEIEPALPITFFKNPTFSENTPNNINTNNNTPMIKVNMKNNDNNEIKINHEEDDKPTRNPFIVINCMSDTPKNDTTNNKYNSNVNFAQTIKHNNLSYNNPFKHEDTKSDYDTKSNADQPVNPDEKNKGLGTTNWIMNIRKKREARKKQIREMRDLKIDKNYVPTSFKEFHLDPKEGIYRVNPQKPENFVEYAKQVAEQKITVEQKKDITSNSSNSYSDSDYSDSYSDSYSESHSSENLSQDKDKNEIGNKYNEKKEYQQGKRQGNPPTVFFNENKTNRAINIHNQIQEKPKLALKLTNDLQRASNIYDINVLNSSAFDDKKIDENEDFDFTTNIMNNLSNSINPTISQSFKVNPNKAQEQSLSKFYNASSNKMENKLNKNLNTNYLTQTKDKENDNSLSGSGNLSFRSEESRQSEKNNRRNMRFLNSLNSNPDFNRSGNTEKMNGDLDLDNNNNNKISRGNIEKTDINTKYNNNYANNTNSNYYNNPENVKLEQPKANSKRKSKSQN